MALRSSALCTVDQVKDYSGIADEHKNDLIELYINAASDLIDEYLGYSPASATFTNEVHSGNGTHFLTLKARPITVLTQVTEDGDTVDISDFVIRTFYIDGYDYIFVRGNSNYKVTYTAGYTAATMPRIITLTCVKLASLMIKEDGRTGSLGTTSISHGDGSRTFMDGGYNRVLEAVYPYCREDYD
jgi:hypothetical protein